MHNTGCATCASVLAGDPIIPISPVPTLINTNAIPSPAEESAIRVILHDMNIDLLQLDGKIDRIQAVLDEVRIKRQVFSEACHHYSRQHLPLLSPIRRLPHEILSEIYLLSIDWKDKNYGFRRSVMLPASVCRHWRGVALSTPRLWSSISLNLQEDSVEADVNLTRTWLIRSGNLPLSIRIHYIQPKDRNSLNTHPAIDALTQHSGRWQYAEFEIPTSMWKQIKPAKNHLARLRGIVIAVPFQYSLFGLPTNIFEVAPQLASLEIGCAMSLGLKVPWTQLTRIVAPMQSSLDQCYKVLQNAVNLVECDLRISNSWLGTSHVIIRHTHLRILKIAVVHVDPGPLFDRLSLPALRCIDFYDEGSWSQSQFISLLSRSSCHLETFILLSYNTLSFQEDDLLECLRHMPTLVHLQLNCMAGASMTNEVIAQLTLPWSMPQSEGTSYLVPKLEFLGFYAIDEIAGLPFATMIKSRRHIGVQQIHTSLLKSLRFEYEVHQDEWTLMSLREFAESGLDLHIAYHNRSPTPMSD